MKLQLMGGVCKTHPSGSSLITSTHLAQHPHHYTHNGKDNKGETAPTATYIDIKVGNVTANACMAASERGDRKTITNGTTAGADHHELTVMVDMWGLAVGSRGNRATAANAGTRAGADHQERTIKGDN